MKYWVRSKDADMHVIPTDTLYVTIDKNAVKHSGMMVASDTIPDRMVISLKGKNAYLCRLDGGSGKLYESR